MAKELKTHDIFITASKSDPCSNSLIEALHCGLPCIVYNDGGHPEIVSKGGEVFDNADEIPLLLEKIISRYSYYQDNIVLPKIEKVAQSYINFIETVYNESQNEAYNLKKITLFSGFKIGFLLLANYFSRKINNVGRIVKQIKNN